MGSPLLLLLICFTVTSYNDRIEGAKQIDNSNVDTHSNRRLSVLLAGDSLVEQGVNPRRGGWVSLLQYRYTGSTEVLSRGLSGYNTRWFLKYVMPDLKDEVKRGAYSPALIVVWLGTNDAALVNGSNQEMHVPVEDYAKNLVEIVTKFQAAAPDAKILLITPPHVDDDARVEYAATRNDSKRGLVDRSNAEAGRYALACTEAASNAGVPVFDLYSYFNAMPAPTRNALLQDGIHFNTAGNQLVDEQFRSKIRTEFPALVANMESLQFPAASKWVAEDPYTPVNTVTSQASSRLLL
ncbi:hypothetical protein PHYBOEH_005898 [Phytophthora boehmeriae]|uniref:SGNH hydrolase-type esterase domain-containing protein n=1 Tax=Phytophthora boehmeriae TaxID=109152 RepID=A0A8T1WQC2_9STRA|nr:hypothetical protein PHYBOEH_005898 [Phytophthora boehmeriae]